MSLELIYDYLSEIRTSKISNLITNPTIIDPSSTVAKAINTILLKNSYDAFCVQNSSILATSVRELIAAKDITRMKVSPFLHKARTVSLNDTIEKAAAIMSHYRTRAVPVFDGKTFSGVVEAKNVLKLLSGKDLKWIKANAIFTPTPVTVSSTDPLSKAKSLMITKRFDHIPVIHKNKVRQVLTSTHILQLINPHEKISRNLIGVNKSLRFDAQVANLGSKRIPQCKTNDNLNVIIDAMLRNDASCCLVTLWDNLHGIIAYKDLFGLLESRIQSEVPAYVVGMPQDHHNSEIVKSKFSKIIQRVRKVYPEIEEARAIIKQHHAKGQRQFYQVTVNVISPYRILNYTQVGWDFSRIFDLIGKKIRRKVSKKRKQRSKKSIRKREPKIF